MHRGLHSLFLITLFLITSYVQAQSPSLPDFEVEGTSITFSNPSPLEGEEITIFVTVKNVGHVAPTRNEDLVVNLYEGDPYTGDPAAEPLRILCRDVILGLEPGKSDAVKAQWRPPAGTTEIYTLVNPTGDEKEIREASRNNNTAHTSITAAQRTFPKATPEQIQTAIQKGVEWVKSQQGRHSRTCLQCGTENQLISICVICTATLKGLPEDQLPGSAWDFGEDSKQETALALQALLSAGVPVSDPAVQKGFDFLMSANWNLFAVYHHAVIVPALAATNDPKYRQRAQFAVNKLIERQLPIKGSEYSDVRDKGGWGYGDAADGAHMNMVIYALYAAKQWNLQIPQDTWERAEKWIRGTQTETGGFLYSLTEGGSPWAEGVYGSMTATGLWALRACDVSVSDPQIQKGLVWLKKYWSITRNPGAFSWLHYYLLSLQRFCDIPPKLNTLAGHNWYEEISNMIVADQHPDGRWIGAEGDFAATCFALMSLTRALPRPTSPNLGAVNRSIRFSPPTPRIGEPARISVTLTNTGAPLDAIVEVEFYNGNPDGGGKKIHSQEVLFSNNIDETTTTVNWAATEAGKHDIHIRVDPNEQIADLDLSNNTVSQVVVIRPKSADALNPADYPRRKIGDGIYQIGNVTFDVNKREVSTVGEINIIGGDTIIEFFACGKLGKTHESIIMLDVEPVHIFLALGALDMAPGMNLTVEGDPHEPQGDPTEIWIEWERGGETVRHRAEKLVWNVMEERPMQQTHWVFTGGRVIRGQFTAQLFHNIIAVYRDPDSIFNHPLPGGKDDRTYRVHTDVMPPKGTQVKVIIHPIGNGAQG